MAGPFKDWADSISWYSRVDFDGASAPAIADNGTPGPFSFTGGAGATFQSNGNLIGDSADDALLIPNASNSAPISDANPPTTPLGTSTTGTLVFGFRMTGNTGDTTFRSIAECYHSPGAGQNIGWRLSAQDDATAQTFFQLWDSGTNDDQRGFLGTISKADEWILLVVRQDGNGFHGSGNFRFIFASGGTEYGVAGTPGSAPNGVWMDEVDDASLVLTFGGTSGSNNIANEWSFFGYTETVLTDAKITEGLNAWQGVAPVTSVTKRRARRRIYTFEPA